MLALVSDERGFFNAEGFRFKDDGGSVSLF